MSVISYLKNKGIKRVLDVIWQYKIDRVVQKVFCVFFRKLPLDNIIIIESHNDFDYNGGAFYDFLIKKNYNKKYKIIWLIKNQYDNIELPENVKCYKLFAPNLKKDYYICRAKFFTADCMITPKVREDQKYIFFDHGSIGLKNFSQWYHIPDYVNYILTPSEKWGKIQAKQYNMEFDKNRFICLGYPVQDILFQKSNHEINKITNQKYSKIILWMPTFRKNKTSNRNDSTKEFPMGVPLIENENMLLKLNADLKQLNVLLIIKLHPMQDISAIRLHECSNIIVLTGKDVKEKHIDNCRLMKDVDAMVSDYSSAAYDFLMLNKPIGYDFSDLESYTIGLCVENVDEYIAGQKIMNYADFIKFIKNVYEEKDDYRDRRIELKNKLYKYADANNCCRIAQFLKL